MIVIYPKIYEVSKVSFGIAFLMIRIIYWSIFDVRLLKQMYDVFAADVVHSYPVMYFLCFTIVVMTLLQIYWAVLIIKALFQGGYLSLLKIYPGVILQF